MNFTIDLHLSRLVGKSTMWFGLNISIQYKLSNITYNTKYTVGYESVSLYTNLSPCQCGFRTGPTQIRLYSHRSRLETGNFGFRK